MIFKCNLSYFMVNHSILSLYSLPHVLEVEIKIVQQLIISIMLTINHKTINNLNDNYFETHGYKLK